MPSLYHAGFTVEDLDESVAFYRDVVGMEPVEGRCDLQIAGDWFDQLTDNEGAELRVSHLALDGFELQLVEYTAAGGGRLPLHHNRIGNPHLCIEAPGIDARQAALSAEGRYKTSPVVEITGTGSRSFYVTDPNGVLVEFIERPA